MANAVDGDGNTAKHLEGNPTAGSAKKR